MGYTSQTTLLITTRRQHLCGNIFSFCNDLFPFKDRTNLLSNHFFVVYSAPNLENFKLFPSSESYFFSAAGGLGCTHMIPGVSQGELSERLRKRRCFADRELDSTILMNDVRQPQLSGNTGSVIPHVTDFTRFSPKASGVHEKLVLKRLFPAINEQVMELMWQACGCDFGKCFQQMLRSTQLSRSSFLPPLHHSYVCMPQLPHRINNSNLVSDRRLEGLKQETEPEVPKEMRYSGPYMNKVYEGEKNNFFVVNERTPNKIKEENNLVRRDLDISSQKELKFSVASILGTN